MIISLTNCHFFKPKTAYNTDCKTDKNKPNKIEEKNPSTINPGNKTSAIFIIIALMIKRKNPKVKTVSGKVNNIKAGFTNKFKRLKTKAIQIAELKLLTVTPGKRFAIITTAKPLINRFTKYFMFFDLKITKKKYFSIQ